MFAYTKLMQAMAAAGVVSATDPYFNLTTLLLNTSSTNGAQNNTFLDSSTNNFTITRNGNTTQGTFTPFSQTGWSNYFDGTDDFYTSSTALFNYTTGNASTQTATIEAFVYITAFQSAPANIWENPCIAGKGDTYMNFGVNASGNLFIYHYDGAARTTTSSGTLSANAWNHVAAVISGGTITLYINGTSSGSGTWYGIDAGGQNSTSYFGETPDADSRAWLGYISNLRVSTTARTITVPTSPYVNDGNTAFLTFQSNRVVDNSSNGYALTVGGTPSVQAFSPFLSTAAYDTAVVGGSGYFDGTSDYLSLSSTSLNLGANDFTIEMWVYATTTARDFVIGSISNAAGLGSWMIMFNDSQPIRFFCRYNTGTVLDYQVGSGTFPINQWVHLAVTRSGANLRVFQNGTQVGTTNTTLSTFSIDNATNNYYVASSTDPSEFYTGYLSGTRLLVGTALYTTTFTPPTAPPTAVTNTALLLNYTNSGIFDSTAKNVLETVGNAQVSTTQAKWGTTSMYFDGTGDNLSFPSNNLYNFGSSDFTIEFWFYPPSITYGAILYSTNNGSKTDTFAIYSYGSSQSPANSIVALVTASGGGAWSLFNNQNLGSTTAATWQHVALVRNGSTFKGYINGVAGFTVTSSSAIASFNGFSIASNGASGDYLTGYIDDLRITRYARYTADFTPPAAAFPTQ
jgi:hypothetical protein